LPPPPSSRPFPYTPLFRSGRGHGVGRVDQDLITVDDLDRAVVTDGHLAHPDRLPCAVERFAEAHRRDRAGRLGTATGRLPDVVEDRKSTRLNSSHVKISYA